ncbi:MULTISPECIES: alanine--tRNA ligase [unclassified Hyphomonas]|jgi:alanyl-tRNA synthetase|uniref:alanine--tRNA ligase n=1 Tax=unclassified Hyphomonas TaxID=2630699 RepID=UPI000C4C3659|nr:MULTISPECIES: alanine--tRNA ligase [unclassified Hyphomonas]MAL43536.1 alanine--tRNA ligase [Hyphomonas sp.]MAX82833.1 alanine--tRNA ligase [Hyphomonas sp.]HBN92754.1 alanine--tRNA ligase [Hyphomonas sp.]HBU35706.1 alanine--tRNA ligase [Hyphomonas sp.]HBX91876.1 alanine--tRNA ligase [Hyphomonas sp.]|tara:strand:+ start:17873 stop:20512 length:2640 start_codon:yes stop_codon:yes gene_type:complete
MTGVNEIRETFLSFFEKRGHLRQASAPLIPQNDPTLLFVNAGMVPFKNIFTGAETPPGPRATTSQKCVRAGGKHNDLDNVGYTARHHTFFEMLGNFSFGDYFKEDAIAFGWELCTKEFALDPKKLLVTVYAEDDEAAALWKKIAGLEDSRIIRIGTSDNFWSMGDTGPCGPCSEIFYDHGESVPGGPPGSPDEDGDRFIEIWNLVFMQFDQQADGSRKNLPKPSIDTGMGLERISAVLQGVHNNYDIDLFKSLIAAEEDLYGAKAAGDQLASFRVIADHLRTSAFLIADGVLPSNEGRGYVLRRIMRRAMRHGHLLGAREPLMYKLAPALISEMGKAYPELGRAKAAIESALEQEEARFQRTLGNGLSLLDKETADMKAGDALPGDVAFKLSDTYGFPLDLTQDILRGREMSVDVDGFETALEQQRQDSRAAGFSSGDQATDDIWFRVRDDAGATSFTGYDGTEGKGKLVAIAAGGARVDALSAGPAELVFDTTPFYAESGGQAGDHGEIVFGNGARFIVRDVQKRAGDLHVHIGELVSGEVRLGDTANLHVDAARRRAIMANHSATHIMHAALRNVLGEHVTQKGSLVEADRFRFDFSHNGPMTPAELEAVEDEVNAQIRENHPTGIQVTSPDKAIEAGALALFGEKYGDEVRVLSMGTGDAQRYSVELCGGTHVERAGDIGVFVIMSESGVSAGVRRIEAATGAEALAYLKGRAQIAVDLAESLKVPLKDVPRRVAALGEERRSLEKELADVKRKLAMGGGGGAPAGPEEINGVKLMARIAEGVGGKELRTLVDEAKAQIGSGIVAFVGVADGKAGVAVGVTKDLTDTYSAVDLVKAASEALGGKGGGGRPDMAQAGGPDTDKADDALAAVRAAIAG